MTRIRKWALAVCSALLLTSYSATSNAQPNANLDPSKTYVTGNLTTFDPSGSATTGAWQNVGQWGGSLTCWGPGDPGYCGPNPYVGAFPNTINFSYGLTDLYQVVNIANALPHSGTGLRVLGFNFGFTAKNGNGWDNGQQDYLVAYVNFYDKSGAVAQSYNYAAQTNQKYAWTTFNFSETFATPYAAKDLSTARYGFVGSDSNFWAGPYGPEVTNVSFGLKYTVDPCYVNRLSSPACPGYQEETARLAPPPSSVVEPAPLPVTIPVSSSSIDTTQPSTASTSSSIAPTTSSAGSITLATATPSATNPQPRVGSVTVSGERDRAAVIADTLQREQKRILSVESLAVENAVTQSRATAQQAQEQSLQISAATVSQSQVSAQTAATVLAPVAVSSVSQGSVSITAVAAQSGQGLKINESVQQLIARSDTDSGDGLKLTGTGPLANFVNPPPRAAETQSESAPGPAVNSQARDNDAAGGVTLAAMARTPQGFEAYMGAVPDARFYDPREIYRGQRVVDNARVQRALSGASDRLHQQMVDQQYRKDR